jgi:hypothetical protein
MYLVQRSTFFMQGLMFFCSTESDVLFTLLVIIISFRGAEVTDERTEWRIQTDNFQDNALLSCTIPPSQLPIYFLFTY